MTHDQLVRVHEPEYLELLRAVDRPTRLDADTVCLVVLARILAAGITLEAVDRNGFNSSGRPAMPSRHGRWGSAF